MDVEDVDEGDGRHDGLSYVCLIWVGTESKDYSR